MPHGSCLEALRHTDSHGGAEAGILVGVRGEGWLAVGGDWTVKTLA